VPQCCDAEAEGGESVNVEEGGQEEEHILDDDPVQDTVGVVVLDRLGNVASSVSSGGIGKRRPLLLM
jgi:isoaspartyl peptidase/L-asparaginase-like protein (Ntn-hydrolase superfamily)